MVVAALVISLVALLASGLVALAVMELVAAGPAGPSAPAADLIEQFEVDDEVAGTLASSHGLPDAIDGAETHLVLFISPMCAMCAGIAESFDGEIPPDVSVVVTASHPQRQRQWASDHQLPAGDVIFDDEMSIVNGLGVTSSPTVVGFGGGRVVFIAGIGGRPALEELLAQRAVTGEWISKEDPRVRVAAPDGAAPRRRSARQPGGARG